MTLSFDEVCGVGTKSVTIFKILMAILVVTSSMNIEFTCGTKWFSAIKLKLWSFRKTKLMLNILLNSFIHNNGMKQKFNLYDKSNFNEPTRDCTRTGKHYK